jgi:hypothetical protein
MKDERQRDKIERAYDRSHVAKQCIACRRWYRPKPKSLALPLCPKCQASRQDGQALPNQ